MKQKNIHYLQFYGIDFKHKPQKFLCSDVSFSYNGSIKIHNLSNQ